MIKRVIRWSVRVIGPPAAIWAWNSGTTEPREPSTLPNRIAEKIGPPSCRWALAAEHNRSPMSLDVPITLVGFTALSDEVENNALDAILKRGLDDILRPDDIR